MKRNLECGDESLATLVVGDTHLKQEYVCAAIDKALAKHAIGEIVFTGDYCDDWLASDGFALKALSGFVEWVEEKRRGGLPICVLLGNHDLCYFRGIEGPGTQVGAMDEIAELLRRLNLVAATVVDDYLVTHAGLTNQWAEEHLQPLQISEESLTACSAAQMLNDMFSDSSCWDALDSCGQGRGGWEIPSPLWADLFELKIDPAIGINQIVGHTPVPVCACVEGNGVHLWFCDTFSLTSALRPIGNGGMLLVKEGKVEVFDFVRYAGESWAETIRDYEANSRDSDQ